jgi:hypothetical protein
VVSDTNARRCSFSTKAARGAATIEVALAHGMDDKRQVPTGARRASLSVWNRPDPCEHAFVTSQGHAHARFRRTLLTKNLKLIEAGSRELQHVGLDDALRVMVDVRRAPRYERAAARFAARVMMERRLGLAQARYVLALAEALPRSPDAVGLLLRPYCG